MIKSLLSILIFISCSSNKKPGDLSINPEDNNSTQKISIYADEVKEEIKKEENKEEKFISIKLYPTLYHSLAMINLIKEIESSNIKIKHLTSFGLGAVVTALYAKEKKISYVEWKLFDLLKKLVSLKPYTSKWYSVIDTFLEGEFSGLKFSDLKIALYVPAYKNEKLFLNNYSLIETLQRTLRITSEESFNINNSDYLFLLREKGIRNLTSIIFLPKRVDFQSLTGFEYGLYTNYLGKVITKTTDINLLYGSKNIPLDKIPPVSLLKSVYSSAVENYLDKLEKDIANWDKEKEEWFN